MFEKLLLRQGGLVAVWQAASHGISPRSLQRKAAGNGWDRLHPGVYLAAGFRLTDEVRVRAAWLWGGEESTVSGPAAAFWLGMLPAAPSEVALTVPPSRGSRAPAGIRLRRRELSHHDRRGIRDIWLTAAPLTAIETATAVTDGSAFLDRALQRHVGLDAVSAAHRRNLGRSGSAAATRLLSAAADGAESAAERLLVAMLRRAGIRGWVLAHPVGRYRIDLAFPAQRLAVEIDGWAWHSDVTRFRADRRKGNDLVAAGWTMLRFTWHDLQTEDPIHRIRAHLDRGRTTTNPSPQARDQGWRR
ncbi:MAG: hypothetical protein ABS81_20490 [Pseudonocardia sp. SCN 72-86]|nr:MAG: hypothetical protein ABS81_20490 [Pseudonocardia sp. SCN 72-86]